MQFCQNKYRAFFLFFLMVVVLFSACQTQKSPVPAYEPSAELDSPVLEAFDFNLFFKGKFKIKKEDKVQSASFEILINDGSFLMSVMNPFGGIIFQIYADYEIISLIDYDKMRVENYANQSQNRINLTGTDFSFNELLTVFSGRMLKTEAQKWQSELGTNGLFSKLTYLPKGTQTDTDTTVNYQSYAAYKKHPFPSKISVIDTRFNFSALFVRTKISLLKKQPIVFPTLPQAFEYVDYPHVL